MKKNSALEWLPKITYDGLPVPRTEIVLYNHRDIVNMLEGRKSETYDKLIKQIGETANYIGYPSFVRTDLASAKHDGEKSYLIRRAEDVVNVICKTVEDNELKFWMGDEIPKAFLVREFLKLDAPFKAFGGLPISREWRYFANENGVICYHPYWPEDAIEFYGENKEPDNWKEMLAELHKEKNADTLEKMAIQAAKVCGGNCSVDFAMDETGKWWLIDMAQANRSWHWPNCNATT